jgi:hypothetical protein
MLPKLLQIDNIYGEAVYAASLGYFVGLHLLLNLALHILINALDVVILWVILLSIDFD